MNRKIIKSLIILLIVALVATLTLSVMSLINPIFFWALAIIAALFAFIVLPRINK